MDTSFFTQATPKKIVLIGLGVLAVLLFGALFGGDMHPNRYTLTMSDAQSVAPPQGMMMEAGESAGGMGVFGYKSIAREDGANVRMASLSPAVAPMPNVPATPSMIVRNADLALLVDDVDAGMKRVDDIRTQFTGQLGSISVNDYGTRRVGDVTLWIPSARFDEALTALRQVALRVTSERIDAVDVSAQYVDIESRLKNLRATEAQYMTIMKRSGTIADVLAVSRELSQTREAIEVLVGQQGYLARQVALSSVHLSLTQDVTSSVAADEWRPLALMKNAYRETLRDLTLFVSFILVFLVKLPVLVLKVLLVLGMFYGVLRIAGMLYRRLRGVSLPSASGKV